MPIRTEERTRYPQDWPDVSAFIRFERAGGRCECTGICGGGYEHLEAIDGRCRNRHNQPRWSGRRTIVILGTAHLDHQPENSDPDNLLALCEGCHLRFDANHHAETRRARQRLGMDPLFWPGTTRGPRPDNPAGASRVRVRRPGSPPR